MLTALSRRAQPVRVWRGTAGLSDAPYEMGRLCADAGVPIAAAARSSRREPRITSTIVGLRRSATSRRRSSSTRSRSRTTPWAALLAVPLDPSAWQEVRPLRRNTCD